jgi:hypothetical protein
MARCTHSSGNIQQYTEICLDCGHNIYESDEEYEQGLQREIRGLQDELRKQRLVRLEQAKEDLQRELGRNNDDDGKNSGGW